MYDRFTAPRCMSIDHKLRLIFTLALSTSPVFAQLTLSPVEIEFSSPVQSKTTRILNDGQPVLPAEIRSVVAGVFKTGDAVPEKASGGTHFSNYSYMFDFKVNDDGSITVTPIESTVQLGTYNLFVSTIHGRTEGVINASFRDSIPARRIEPSVFTYDLELSDYTYGQAVVIDLGLDSRHTYTWYIDGELHSSGLGESSFRAWPEVGSHEISLLIQNAAGETVSRWSGVVKIIAE